MIRFSVAIEITTQTQEFFKGIVAVAGWKQLCKLCW